MGFLASRDGQWTVSPLRILARRSVLVSTVRDASDRDYRLLVLTDASADPEPDVHDFLTQRIFPRQADVIMLADLGDLLSAGVAGN